MRSLAKAEEDMRSRACFLFASLAFQHQKNLDNRYGYGAWVYLSFILFKSLLLSALALV